MLEIELLVEGDPVIELGTDVVAVGDYPMYGGPYSALPTLEGFSLGTRGKAMRADVEVLPIPTAKVSNVAGGYTFTIG